MATKEQWTPTERWARSFWAPGVPSAVERRVLLESPHAKQPSASERFWKSPPIILLILVLMISGIAGVSAFLSSPDLTGSPRQGFDADRAMKVAGVCFALSTIFVIGLFVGWLREGRERSGTAFGVVLMVLVPAAMSLLTLHGDNVLDSASRWTWPVWSAGGLSAAMFVLLVVASRPATEKIQKQKHPLDITTLSPDEVTKLLALRARALRILVLRERLAPEIEERAKHVPLGELHTLDDEARRLKKPT